MSKTNFTKIFSVLLTLVLAFSLLSPVSASADQKLSFKENQQTEAQVEMKAAIAEQLRLTEGKPRLHEALQNMSGEEEVNVIIHLSEKPVGLEKGIVESKGKIFSNANERQARTIARAEQAIAKAAMKKQKLIVKEGFTYDTVLNGFSATVKAKDLEKLLTIEGVTLVEPDVEVQAMEAPAKESISKTPVNGEVEAAMATSISFLGIERLWDEGLEGQGIKVAVLDTGIDADHPEFAGIYKGGKNFVPHDSKYSRDRADDDASETLPSERAAGTPEFNANGSSFYTSHGTHVAGTIAAIGANEFGIKGIAPKVDLYAYRVLGAYGSGSTAGIIAAIEESVVQEMDIINLSLGGGSNTEVDSGSYAINNAMLAGTISVLATGNSGPNRGTMGTPATAPFGIAVGNTTNPEAMYDGQVSITAGAYSLSQQLNLMGTTFGQDLSEQLSGEFEVVAVPGLGAPADYANIDVEGKVALIVRGEIAFVDKIAAAKEAGAVAAIIYNSAAGSGAPGPSGTFLGDAFEFIPTFDMSNTDGVALRAALADSTGTVTFGNFNQSMTEGDEVNSSSSRGPSTPNFDIKPDVSAPGTNIMSTIPMYKTDFPDAEYDEAYSRKTGTSMATPHVAGIAALVLQANPEATPFDVKVSLSNTAKVLDTEKYDVFSQGAGRVDAYAAAHPEILAYSIDTAIPDEGAAAVENVKGTVTFGPQDLNKGDANVTKQVLVRDITGNGGNYNVSIDVDKAFGDAQVTVDKPEFTLSGEEALNFTLTASQAATKAGDEITGHIYISNGATQISLPFAADFAGAASASIEGMSLSETDVSFDGDGVKDSSVLSFTLTGDVGLNFIEIWDIMNPDGGVYGDGYIGYLHAAASLGKGSYTLNIGGEYQPWDGSGAATIPDGLYTIDFSGETANGLIGDYAGPIVVKTTAPEIAATVENGQATGQVTDKYIEYNEELYYYGMDFDLNEKLNASYVLTENGVAGQPVEFDLEQDGSFTFPVTEATESVVVTVADAAGNVGTEEIVFEQPAPEVGLFVDKEDVTMKVLKKDKLKVTMKTLQPDGSVKETDVTNVAKYSVKNSRVATVVNGNIVAKSKGTTDITITHGGYSVTVTVTVQ